MVIDIVCIGHYCDDRLRRGMRGEMQGIVEAEPVQEGLWDVLQAVQLRAAGHVWQLRGLPLLCRHHHARWTEEMPLSGSS